MSLAPAACGTNPQRLVVAAQAEDGADTQGRGSQGVALQGDAVAVAGRHGQHRVAAFAGQEGGTRQGRTVDLVGVVRHHHRVQAGRQRGREPLDGLRAATARRQALGGENQPAGGQCLAELSLHWRHRWYPLLGRAPRPLRPRAGVKGVGGQAVQGLQHCIADGGEPGRPRRRPRRPARRLPAPSAVSSAARAGQVEEHQTLASQPDLIEDGTEIVHPASAALAAFQVVAVVLLASDRADHVGAGLERLENVLRLDPPRARHQHFPHREGPVEARDVRTRPAGGVWRLARTGAIGTHEDRDDSGDGGGAGRLIRIADHRWGNHQSPCLSSKAPSSPPGVMAKLLRKPGTSADQRAMNLILICFSSTMRRRCSLLSLSPIGCSFQSVDRLA